MLADFLLKPAPSRRLSLILLAVIIAAWILLFAWQRSTYAGMLGHEALSHHHISFAAHLSLFLLSWLLMIVAMMLPVSLPAIIDASPNSPRSYAATASVVAGYLAPWLLFGLLAFLGDSVLHDVAGHGGPMERYAGFINPAIILAAGLYQLTPAKRGFIDRCRSAVNAAAPVARDRMTGSLSRGLRLGLNCAGSCGFLMLLMFALGHHRLEWMLILGAIAAAERLPVWGNRLAWIVGIVLIVWAGISVSAVI